MTDTLTRSPITGAEWTTLVDEGHAILAAHNRHGWTFGTDRAKSRLGACHFRTKRITLSASYLATADLAAIRNTVLHEVAHAIAGPAAGHGPVWKRIARQIGCNAERCGENPEGRPVGRYTAECPTHGIVGYRWKLTADTRLRARCGKCRSGLVWNDHGPSGYIPEK
jgi:predicted SprT family Zn-dependent metalloprotease